MAQQASAINASVEILAAVLADAFVPCAMVFLFWIIFILL